MSMSALTIETTTRCVYAMFFTETGNPIYGRQTVNTFHEFKSHEQLNSSAMLFLSDHPKGCVVIIDPKTIITARTQTALVEKEF